MSEFIELDSDLGKELGFTSDKFDGYLGLDLDNKTIFISLIRSKQEGKGNLLQLFRNIVDFGCSIKVPTPSDRMMKICLKYGFKLKHEMFPEPFNEIGEIMVYERRKKK